VVEGGREPAVSSMAGLAGGAKLAIVFIILCVTGVAAGRGAFEDVIDVAAGARHAGMLASQFEARQVVVEGGRKPAGSGMAGATVRAELAVVGIVHLVAGGTVLGRVLKIGDGPGANVALPTAQAGVLPAELEGDLGMVEGMPEAVDPIVTAQAVTSVVLQMGLH